MELIASLMIASLLLVSFENTPSAIFASSTFAVFSWFAFGPGIF